MVDCFFSLGRKTVLVATPLSSLRHVPSLRFPCLFSFPSLITPHFVWKQRCCKQQHTPLKDRWDAPPRQATASSLKMTQMLLKDGEESWQTRQTRSLSHSARHILVYNKYFFEKQKTIKFQWYAILYMLHTMLPWGTWYTPLPESNLSSYPTQTLSTSHDPPCHVQTRIIPTLCSALNKVRFFCTRSITEYIKGMKKAQDAKYAKDKILK